jgi:hypothetical protein
MRGRDTVITNHAIGMVGHAAEIYDEHGRHVMTGWATSLDADYLSGGGIRVSMRLEYAGPFVLTSGEPSGTNVSHEKPKRRIISRDHRAKLERTK